MVALPRFFKQLVRRVSLQTGPSCLAENQSAQIPNFKKPVKTCQTAI